MYVKWDESPPSIEVRNVGTGPAFNIRSVIYDPEAIAMPDQLSSLGPSWKHMSDTKENHWFHWTTDTVSQGESRELQYALPSKLFKNNMFSEANKLIESKDHKRKYAFNAPKQPLSSPNSSTEPWYIGRITITYHDIFHRKHASIYDLVYGQKWQEVAFVDDIISDLGDLVA